MRNILLYFILIESIESKSPLRVIGGRDAASDEYPYVVRLEVQVPITEDNNSTVIKSLHVCTGSVVTPSWTVSAAHCFHFLNDFIRHVTKQSLNARLDGNLVIRYGSVNATSLETDAFSRVNYYIKHPTFRFLTTRYSYYEIRVHNDVALVNHQPISLKQYGKVASIDFKSLTGHEVILAGYGLTQDSQGGLFNTLVLQKPLQVFSGVIVQCLPTKRMYPALCIDRRCGQVIGNACGGDSGGPVLHSAGIVAVITQGQDCNDVLKDGRASHIVSLTTPLSPYIQWITDHVRQNN